ncbi:MAG: 3-methyl-2-oxobutanoate dehydrogenase subunit VorB [Candidatus Wallbacteria bacterium]|nr:3-methyl-2-oxobutanoate dehydrogenase subunit VorB [Candidatus Wallbacteria bacterium]
MRNKLLMPGCEAIAEAAIRAGCTHYFGYPGLALRDIHGHMAARLPAEGGTYVTAENETAAIGMAYGAACAGARVMTSASGTGIGQMQEMLSFMAGAEVPCVVLNVGLSGYSLAGLLPSQADYFQATRGAGQENYRLVALSPSSVQEAADLTVEAFEIAERHRNPVLILADGIVSQMMEPASLVAKKRRPASEKPWTVGPRHNRRPNLVTSIYLEPSALEAQVWKLYKKYQTLSGREVRYEEYRCKDASLILVAGGILGRVARTAVDKGRKRGMKLGLFRPVSLWPFPAEALAEHSRRAKSLLVVELNTGQMVEDVRLATQKHDRVHFYGRTGGSIPSSFEILHEALKWMD